MLGIKLIDGYRKKCFIKAKQDISLWLQFMLVGRGSLSWIPLAALVSSNIMQRAARTQFSLVNPHTSQSQGIPTDSLATDTAFGENDWVVSLYGKTQSHSQRVWISQVISQQRKETDKKHNGKQLSIPALFLPEVERSFHTPLGFSKFVITWVLGKVRRNL